MHKKVDGVGVGVGVGNGNVNGFRQLSRKFVYVAANVSLCMIYGHINK